jgi:WhiB family redox-sensing transcriptional regulator
MSDTVLDALAGNDRGWVERAACAAIPTRRFFPSEAESSAEAIAVCKQCPVSSECLAYALKHLVVNGIWGGTTEPERRRMLRMRPSQPAA